MPKINNQKGVVHLFFLLIIVVLVGGAIFLVTKGIIKIPGISLPSIPILQKQPSVQLKEEYKNPFKKETQYVNPFDKYKNPFVVNR